MNRINFLRKAKKVLLFGLVGVLTIVSALLNKAFDGNVYPYTSVDRTVGFESLERSQGVTTDGESWIFSGKTSLVRVSLDNKEILALNKEAIPTEFSEQYGSAHIGGISYANGFVYAAIEDSKVWKNPIVALFDGDTLEFTGEYVLLPGKDSDSEYALTRGVPWVTCDVDNGCFYVGECRHTTQLYAFDLETFEYIKTIPLETEVDRIQGAEMYNGRLYAATNDATRAVYQISLKTGKVLKYFDRILYQPKLIDNFGGEGEDITVLPMADGTVFHALNIGALFVDANLRHYAPVPGIDTLPEQTDTPDEPTKPERPQVTYLDKYVLNILEGDQYTLEMETIRDGKPLHLTSYKDGNNSAAKIRLSDILGSNLPSVGGLDEIRIVTRGTEMFIAWTGGYLRIDEDTAKEMIPAQGDLSSAFDKQALEYYGVVSGTGYVCECYFDTEHQQLSYIYFTSNGITRWEIVDPETKEIIETMSLSLNPVVTDSRVFMLSGREYTLEEFENLFAGMAS